jgi:hypothetical protein
MSVFRVGDLVYARKVSGAYGRDVEVPRRIVRSTHDGRRMVVEGGTVFLARNGDQVGDEWTVWKRYTPEVQAEWDARARWTRVAIRLGRCHIEAGKYRNYPIEACEEIATVCEKHLDAYQRARDEENRAERARIAEQARVQAENAPHVSAQDGTT